MSPLWMALWEPTAFAQACEFLADGAPTTRLDCAAAERWSVRCRVKGTAGRRRVRLAVDEWGLEAETRLPLQSDERFEVTLLGPEGSRGDFTVDGNATRLSDQVVGALQLCRAGADTATLRITVTSHQQRGFAEQVDPNGVVNRVPTYDAGEVVATAEASIVAPPPGEGPNAAPPAERVRGKLSVRHGEGWADLTWNGRLQKVSAESGAVTLLRLDFPTAQVKRALGPGDPATLLAEDLVRWLSGDHDSRLGLVAFRRSGMRVPIAEVPTFGAAADGPDGWRGAHGGTSAFSIGAIDKTTVRVAIAFRPQPLDAEADAALNPLWTAPLVD